MLKNTQINRIATRTIALALGELNERVVYVGGAVVSFYIDDTAADDVRPTKDIDISMQIASLSELEQIREVLIKKGFYQSSEDDVVCRFRYQDIKVDVMATKAIGWAPANPWFERGFDQLIEFDMDGIKIKCLNLPYYLATKFTAFYERGIKDPRTSHDFEDIVYILNYCSNFVELISQAHYDVRNYLLDCFQEILNDGTKQEAILGNLFYENQEFRFNKIVAHLNCLINGNERE
jgi:predicted nucleotidyltransferase